MKTQANLGGKTVLIAGGLGPGICWPTTLAVAAAGPAKVAITSRDNSKLSQALKTLRRQYPNVEFKGYLLDVLAKPSSHKSVRGFLDAFGKDNTGIDVLLMMVGGNRKDALVLPGKPFGETSFQVLEDVFRLNLLGPTEVIHGADRFLQDCASSDDPAVVVTIGSATSYGLWAGLPTGYSVAKQALVQQAVNLDLHNKKSAIPVRHIPVIPGVVLGEQNAALLLREPDKTFWTGHVSLQIAQRDPRSINPSDLTDRGRQICPLFGIEVQRVPRGFGTVISEMK